MSKLLFLYGLPKSNGACHFQSHRLVDDLRSLFDVHLAFGVAADTYHATYEQLMPGEFLSESEFRDGDYDLIYIEDSLLVTELGSCYRGDLTILRMFKQRGGVVVLEHRRSPTFLTDKPGTALTEPPISIVNRCLRNIGFESYLTTHRGQPEVNADRLPGRDSEWGRGSDDQYELPQGRLRIEVTDEYLKFVDPRFRRLYEGLDPLVIGNPIGVEIWSEPLLVGNPKSSRLLLESDFYYDGIANPVFGSVRTRDGGAAALIAADVASDSLVVEHGDAGVVLMTRIAEALVEEQATRRRTVLYRHQQNSSLIISGVNVDDLLAGAPWAHLVSQNIAEPGTANDLRRQIADEDAKAALTLMRTVAEQVVDHLLSTAPRRTPPAETAEPRRSNRRRGNKERGKDFREKIDHVRDAYGTDVPPPVISALHSIRSHGNHGAHRYVPNVFDAVIVLPLLIRVITWFSETHLNNDAIPQAVEERAV